MHYESFVDFEPLIEEAIKERKIYNLPRQEKDEFADFL